MIRVLEGRKPHIGQKVKVPPKNLLQDKDYYTDDIGKRLGNSNCWFDTRISDIADNGFVYLQGLGDCLFDADDLLLDTFEILDSGYADNKADFEEIKKKWKEKDPYAKVRRKRTDTRGLINYQVEKDWSLVP